MDFELDFDLGDVKELRTLPDGVYHLRVGHFDVKDTQTGNKKLVYETDIIAPQAVRQFVDKYFVQLPLAENARWRVKNFTKACGRLQVGKPFNPEWNVGAELLVVLSIEETEQWGQRNRDIAYMRVGKAEPEVTGDISLLEADASESKNVGSSEVVETSDVPF